jgi:hypothetical protein
MSSMTNLRSSGAYCLTCQEGSSKRAAAAAAHVVATPSGGSHQLKVCQHLTEVFPVETSLYLLRTSAGKSCTCEQAGTAVKLKSGCSITDGLHDKHDMFCLQSSQVVHFKWAGIIKLVTFCSQVITPSLP